jgi:hypothetical protein
VDTPPGSVQGLMLVVPDVRAARAVFFKDPDGNGCAAQQLPDRA